MRSLVTLLTASLLVTSSVACQRTAIDDGYDRAVAEARSRAEERFVYTSCEGGGVAARCGLILKHVARDSFRERFRERACGALSDDECQARFNRFVEGQLHARYTSAAWTDIATYCDSHPTHCDDPIAYELLLVDNHNANVREALSREKLSIAEARRAERAYAEHDGPKCRSYPSVLTGTTLTLCR